MLTLTCFLRYVWTYSVWLGCSDLLSLLLSNMVTWILKLTHIEWNSDKKQSLIIKQNLPSILTAKPCFSSQHEYDSHRYSIVWPACMSDGYWMGCCIYRSQPEMSLVWPERRSLVWPERPCLEWLEWMCLVWPEQMCFVWPEMTVDSDTGWWHSGVLALSYILAFWHS